MENLTNLQGFDFSDNQLTGELPEVLGVLSRLQRIDLSGNELSGQIPASLGGLASLEELHLNGNNLSGPIPRQLGNPTGLELLRLESNRLTGEIPLYRRRSRLPSGWRSLPSLPHRGSPGVPTPADHPLRRQRKRED